MSLFACALLVLCPQDPSQGLQRYQAGDFAAAADAFRAATVARPEAADLWYDLALAEWRAGKLAAAEEAAERYASTPGGGRVDLHRGLLGNIRYGEAEDFAKQAEAPPAPPVQQPPAAGGAASPPPPPPPADPVALLEQAVAKAKASRDEFVRAAAAPTAGGEVARNTERALRLLADLEKKLEEAKKRRDEQQKQDDKNKSDQQKQDKSDDQKDQKDKNDKNDKQDEQPKQDQKDQQQQQDKDSKQQDQQQKDQQQQADQPKDGEARPEPKDAAPKQQPDDKDAQKAAQTRNDAPGEQLQPTELTPEQKARLLEELQKLDEQLRKYRAAVRIGKKPVERDW